MAVSPPEATQPLPAAVSIVELNPHDGNYSERPSGFPAARIQPKRDKPLEWLSGFTVNEEPVFWMSAKRKGPVVDRRFLSDLERVDIVGLSKGEQKLVGRALVPIDPLSLAVALIEAEVIMTYVHVESKVRLDDRFQTDEAMEFRFSGEHVYYTNEENVDPLAFMVKVTNEGKIFVVGLGS